MYKTHHLKGPKCHAQYQREWLLANRISMTVIHHVIVLIIGLLVVVEYKYYLDYRILVLVDRTSRHH